MKKVGIFYGPQGGSTERVAQKIAKAFGESNCDLILVKNAGKADVEKYDNVVFGLSTIGKETWSATNPSNDWDNFLPQIESINFSGKAVAIFGLGDHITYDLHFCDAMGTLGEALLSKGVDPKGRVSTDMYEFRESKAVFDGKFIGLPIDEDFDADETDNRVTKWVSELKKEFK